MAMQPRVSDGHYRTFKSGRPKVTMIVNEEISALAPYAGLILTISLVIIFLVRYYIFEGFLLLRLYGKTYTNLDDNRRRGFINHHVAAVCKIVVLFSGAYPFFSVLAGKSLHHPVAGSSVVTLGDVLLVLNQIFISMYIFELLFRAKLSYVAVAHHIGSVTIAAAAVAISLNWEHQRDATLEFILCCLWGIFDVLAEFWPHIAIILYRMHPTAHTFLCKVFFAAMLVTFSGTIVETIVVMYFWGWAWDRWTLPFRILTPMLHTVFSAAQLWGAWNFRDLWMKHKKLAKMEGDAGNDGGAEERRLEEQRREEKARAGTEVRPVEV